MQEVKSGWGVGREGIPSKTRHPLRGRVAGAPTHGDGARGDTLPPFAHLGQCRVGKVSEPQKDESPVDSWVSRGFQSICSGKLRRRVQSGMETFYFPPPPLQPCRNHRPGDDAAHTLPCPLSAIRDMNHQRSCAFGCGAKTLVNGACTQQGQGSAGLQDANSRVTVLVGEQREEGGTLRTQRSLWAKQKRGAESS